jgi:hypothetical protein
VAVALSMEQLASLITQYLVVQVVVHKETLNLVA